MFVTFPFSISPCNTPSLFRTSAPRRSSSTYDVLTELRGRAVNKTGTLFQRNDGSSWFVARRFIHEQFPAIVKAAGLHSEERTQNVTIHTMRHTFGSWLAISGVPLRRIEYLMGHTSIKTTERYAHPVKEETYKDTEHLQGMTSAYRPKNGQQEETVNAAV
jgi:site-specific recombinase XerD